MTPLFKKLNLKDQKEILILNAPPGFKKEAATIARSVTVHTEVQGAGKVGFVLAFVTTQREIEALAPLIEGRLEGDGVLWFCYPKGSSKKYKCDFNRDSGWESLGRLGFEPVRQVAVDEDWSALRFRRVQFIKKLTRGFAMTEEGKKRIER